MERLDGSSNLRICKRQRPPLLQVDRACEHHEATPCELYYPHLRNHLPPLPHQHRLLHSLQRHHFRSNRRNHANVLHLYVLRSLSPRCTPRAHSKSTLEPRSLGCGSQPHRHCLCHVHLLLVLLAARGTSHGGELQLGSCAVHGYANHIFDYVCCSGKICVQGPSHNYQGCEGGIDF